MRVTEHSRLSSSAARLNTASPCPPRAVDAEEWQAIGDGRFYRNFDGENREVAAGTKYGEDPVVYAHGVQRTTEALRMERTSSSRLPASPSPPSIPTASRRIPASPSPGKPPAGWPM